MDTVTLKPTSLWEEDVRVQCVPWPQLEVWPFKPFSLSGQVTPGRKHPSAWTGWWQPSISTEDLAMPQARRRHLARKSRKEWTSREINPQSLPIPYQINTKLPEIHTNVNEIQYTKLLSTTQLTKYYWPWQDGLSLNQTMSPVTLESQSVTELSQWGGVHPSGPLRGPCLSPLPSKPSLLKVRSTAQQHRYYLGALDLQPLGPHPDWLDQKLCFNQIPGVAGWQGVGWGAGQGRFVSLGKSEQSWPKLLLVLMVHTQPRSQLPSPEQVSLTQMPRINLALSLAHLGYLSFQKLLVHSSSSSIRASSLALPLP